MSVNIPPVDKKGTKRFLIYETYRENSPYSEKLELNEPTELGVERLPEFLSSLKHVEDRKPVTIVLVAREHREML